MSNISELHEQLKKINDKGIYGFRRQISEIIALQEGLYKQAEEKVDEEYLSIFVESIKSIKMLFLKLSSDYQKIETVRDNMENACFRLRHTNQELEKQLKSLQDECDELKIKYNKQIEKELLEVSPRKTIDETLKDFSQAIQTLFDKIDEIQTKSEPTKEKYLFK